MKKFYTLFFMGDEVAENAIISDGGDVFVGMSDGRFTPINLPSHELEIEFDNSRRNVNLPRAMVTDVLFSAVENDISFIPYINGRGEVYRRNGNTNEFIPTNVDNDEVMVSIGDGSEVKVICLK